MGGLALFFSTKQTPDHSKDVVSFSDISTSKKAVQFL